MQADQTDIALANTLDNLRETGAGGATALAQAALKSKQGITANIQQQETQNQKLAAQGQQRMEQLKGAGEQARFNMQENRDVRDINRLQMQMDLAQQQRAAGLATGAAALASGIGGLSTFINPEAKNTESTMDNTNFTANATNAANQAGLNQIAGMQLMDPGPDPSFDFSLSADIFADPNATSQYGQLGISNMVAERDRLRQAGKSTADLQALINSTTKLIK